jgi:bifunctional ADP-heptose synthase (sugar kinase/adenylyltransferase)
MTPERLRTITSRYSGLCIAVVGDFCLDRYLEIDHALRDTSIETGLAVHNVVRVRAQPGGAGTILNNLAALGVGRIIPVSFCGDDGEGYELRRELAKRPGVELDHFVTTPERRTFTYCKPLVIMPDREPIELNRLDSKNWTPTSPSLAKRLADGLCEISGDVDAIVVLEQVEHPETGVITSGLLTVIGELAAANPDLPILADSRRGLTGWPRLSFKMNATELTTMFGCDLPVSVDEAESRALALARRNGRPVFVTLAARGIVGASPDGTTEHVSALPIRGSIDIVGAGDAVTANLAASLPSGASLREAIELAAVASSVVIHQLGTTGTASVADLIELVDRIAPA